MNYLGSLLAVVLVVGSIGDAAACVPTSKRFYGVTNKDVEVMGRKLKFSTDIEYSLRHSQYKGRTFARFSEGMFIDFSNFREAWPSIIGPLIPASGSSNRFVSHGLSVSPTSDGSMLARAHVTYENWSRFCTKVPEFRDLRITMKNRCISNKNLQTTFVLDAKVTPSVRNGQLHLDVGTSVSGADIPGWLRSIADVASFGTLGEELEKTKRSLLDDLSVVLNNQIDKADITSSIADETNSAITNNSNDIRDIMRFNMNTASFLNEDSRLLLSLVSQGQSHFKENTACAQLSALNLGGTSAPKPPKNSRPSTSGLNPGIDFPLPGQTHLP
ncbi:MAG: hypothetical protein ABJ358_15470 [Rhizobiaceae bacterium]